MKYRADIDGLRAIAILLVVIYHAFPHVLKNGFIGVDIFFVISGFLIGRITYTQFLEDRFSLTDFFKRRMRRLFPSLFLVLGASLIYGYFFLFPTELIQLGKHVLGGLFYSANILLWSEAGYFDTASELKPLLHLWSLSLEEQFYIFWGLLLFFVRKSWLSKLIVAVALISFAANILFIQTNPQAVFFIPIFRFWEILVGVVLAVFIAEIKSEKWSQVTAVLGLLLIVGGCWILKGGSGFPGWGALLPTIGAALLIMSPRSFFNTKVLSSKILVGIGLISYPLYLWHWPVLSFLRMNRKEDLVDGEIWIAVVLSFVLAALTRHYLEKPFAISFSRRKKTLLVVTVVFLVGAAFLPLKTGLPERFPSELYRVVSIKNVYQHFEYGEVYREKVCHSLPQNTPIEFILSKCVESKPAQNPLVLLLGDSYGAALYSGLISLQAEKQFRIGQYTMGNAPPYLNSDSSDLADNKEPVSTVYKRSLEIVERTQPEIVIFAWLYRQTNALSMPETVKGVVETVKAIHKLSPQTRIVVLGPLPDWHSHMKDLYIKHWTLTREFPEIYSDFGLREEFQEWDQALSLALQSERAEYISPQKYLCNSEGCRTRMSDDILSLTTIDYGHLLREGSEYLLRAIADKIFNPED